MKAEVPSKNYERGINHNYLILSKCSFFGNGGIDEKDYRVRMFLENNIKGLLPATYRRTDKESKFYYEINSLQSLERVLEKRELGSHELKAIFIGCIRIFETLEEYLLDGAQVILDCDYIYVDIEKLTPYFIYYPDYEHDVRQSFTELVDKLLTRINHNDERAVMMGYQVYRYTRNPNFVMGEIRQYVEHMPDKAASMQEKTMDADYREPYMEEAYIEDIYDEEERNKPKYKYMGDIIGGIICVIIALGIAGLAVTISVYSPLMLDTGRLASLYGAAVMAFAAAVMFFYDGNKKRRLGKLSENEESDDEPLLWENENKRHTAPTEKAIHKAITNEREEFFYGETICLAEGILEEKVLKGRLNGEEISVPLDKLPMTVGKLAGMSDYVIDDNTVSKMHARFEEHDGKIYMYDLNSTNGTLKNGEFVKINAPTQLDVGDKIKMGRVSLTYC